VPNIGVLCALQHSSCTIRLHATFNCVHVTGCTGAFTSSAFDTKLLCSLPIKCAAVLYREQCTQSYWTRSNENVYPTAPTLKKRLFLICTPVLQFHHLVCDLVLLADGCLVLFRERSLGTFCPVQSLQKQQLHVKCMYSPSIQFNGSSRKEIAVDLIKLGCYQLDEALPG